MHRRTQNYAKIVMLACYSCPPVGYLLFQNAVYLSLWKILCMYTNGWLDATVKGEFVCNFAGGYADINSLSNLKAII